MRHAVSQVYALVTMASVVVTFIMYTEMHYKEKGNSDCGPRRLQIDLINHQDTNADVPLVCCPPSMTRTTCVPGLAWRWGDTVCVPKQLKQPPPRPKREASRKRQQQLVLVTHHQRYPVTSNATGDGHWSSGSIFTSYRSIRESQRSVSLIISACDISGPSWIPNAKKSKKIAFPVWQSWINGIQSLCGKWTTLIDTTGFGCVWTQFRPEFRDTLYNVFVYKMI